MSKERLGAARTSFFSLPPCGGGLGRGVATNSHLTRGTPLPASLRDADLPRKGGGDNNNGRRQ
jgi:hypothetical protein